MLPIIPRWAFTAAAALILLTAGFAAGYRVKSNSVARQTVAAVVKAAKEEARDEIAIDRQNAADTTRIAKLEGDLAAARAAAATRGVPNCPARPLPSAEGNAGAGAQARAAEESVRRYEEAYRGLRNKLLDYGALAESLRAQVQACQEQWPR